jgi:hypothetical protein
MARAGNYHIVRGANAILHDQFLYSCNPQQGVNA